MKVALVIPNNLWFCPYVSIYTNVLQEKGFDYDIISWNRDGVAEDAIQYNFQLRRKNSLSLLCGYIRFARFVKKVLASTSYDRVIVFTPQSAIFLAGFLKRNFAEKYIFDYRDLSIEQKRIFLPVFKQVLRNSYANVISSPGFKQYLPKGFKFLISHNFDISDVQKSLEDTSKIVLPQNPIDVLTIGGIRDFDSNIQVIKALVNNKDFNIRFVGKGPSAKSLKDASDSFRAENIIFEGYYPKDKEKEYICGTTFLNIFYPRIPSHDTALSNRFYNSLIYKRPMIVTAETTQGKYVEDYGLGVAITNADNLDFELKSFIINLDFDDYKRSCNLLLRKFLHDYESWKQVMSEFLK